MSITQQRYPLQSYLSSLRPFVNQNILPQGNIPRGQQGQPITRGSTTFDARTRYIKSYPMYMAISRNGLQSDNAATAIDIAGKLGPLKSGSMGDWVFADYFSQLLGASAESAPRWDFYIRAMSQALLERQGRHSTGIYVPSFVRSPTPNVPWVDEPFIRGRFEKPEIIREGYAAAIEQDALNNPFHTAVLKSLVNNLKSSFLTNNGNNIITNSHFFRISPRIWYSSRSPGVQDNINAKLGTTEAISVGGHNITVDNVLRILTPMYWLSFQLTGMVQHRETYTVRNLQAASTPIIDPRKLAMYYAYWCFLKQLSGDEPYWWNEYRNIRNELTRGQCQGNRTLLGFLMSFDQNTLPLLQAGDNSLKSAIMNDIDLYCNPAAEIDPSGIGIGEDGGFGFDGDAVLDEEAVSDVIHDGAAGDAGEVGSGGIPPGIDDDGAPDGSHTEGDTTDTQDDASPPVVPAPKQKSNTGMIVGAVVATAALGGFAYWMWRKP